jgi:hypothetical protein
MACFGLCIFLLFHAAMPTPTSYVLHSGQLPTALWAIKAFERPRASCLPQNFHGASAASCPVPSSQCCHRYITPIPAVAPLPGMVVGRTGVEKIRYIGAQLNC